jgi:hypothetical protein
MRVRFARQPGAAAAAVGVNASEKQAFSASPLAMKAGTAASTMRIEPQT